MDNYNFWQDLLDTYQSLSDWMKFVWLATPMVFGLGLVALVLRYRLASKRANSGLDGDLVYTVYRDADHQLQVFRHTKFSDTSPNIVLLQEPAYRLQRDEFTPSDEKL